MVVDNKAKLSYIQIIKEDLGVFHITPDNGPIPDFKAGQFVTLGFHIPSEGKIVRRAYSIASPPEQKRRFELYIRWVRKPVPGRLTTELFNKKEGDEILWVKPTGIFTINEKLPDGRPDDRRMVRVVSISHRRARGVSNTATEKTTKSTLFNIGANTYHN